MAWVEKIVERMRRRNERNAEPRTFFRIQPLMAQATGQCLVVLPAIRKFLSGHLDLNAWVSHLWKYSAERSVLFSNESTLGAQLERAANQSPPAMPERQKFKGGHS
jgi:hypothetical protein